MSNLFVSFRYWIHGFFFCCSVVILVISSTLASHFLPQHQGLLILSIVASALTIFILFLLNGGPQPQFELSAILLLSWLWLGLGAYTGDYIGDTQCYLLTGTISASGKDYSNKGFCQQIKVINAFSWALFAVMSAYWVLVYFIVGFVETRIPYIWEGNIDDVYFPDEERAVYPAGIRGPGRLGGGAYPAGNVVQTGPNSQGVYPLPGHQVVVATDGSGQQQITQVPIGFS
ncbi:uncharacterized protein EI90DRAFT_3048476 [Cantharellus anzutake]|uniref:uncharacterized protein n=1 Tax=Cantharellus anzutake TaxID=1750568 RepID=UPI0019069555|nr:uncharacterized protein EI90DRAFT_3048476 [Cantharellus anzutake]KAF8335469.1 hypothetical protein EI90DRAFT_3048476 [Cantharellus anzutake]